MKAVFDFKTCMIEEYDKLLEEQSGCCAICEKNEKLHVDHDHNTGEVRGLLCGSCNLAIGLMRDNYKIAEAAATYLRNNNAHYIAFP